MEFPIIGQRPERVISGNPKRMSRWEDLSYIQVHTVLVSGLKRTMDPEDIRRMGRLLPHSRVVLTAGSHLEMYDVEQEYSGAIAEFIDEVVKGRFQ